MESKYDDEVDDSCKEEVIVMYEGKKSKIRVEAMDESTKEPKPWDEVLISNLQRAIEDELGVPMGAQRLGFSDFKHRGVGDGSIVAELSMSDVGIKQGSLVHLV